MKPSELIDKLIADLPDWRGRRLAELRMIINESDTGLTEDWKWGTPVWTSNGNVVGLGAFKEHVKINFFKGASLPDPANLFNAGLDARTTRSIDLREDDAIHERALADLVRAAVGQNRK
jgi:hypothetical protein